MSKLYEMANEPERGVLVSIPVDHINPHPDNPRKDLGDLTELAESIKQSGILQNLTVVPWFSSITRQPADDGSMDGYYRALIGHRRLAAAKLAGLTEVPCVIVEMDYKEQLQTMLQENMQRSDLTIYEQARGFQLMLDLGESVESLAEKSGFSQSTIRRRVKLLDLDEDAFKAAVERGGTLADYAELDKLEDPAAKNAVLEHIGTDNFKWKLNQALEKQKNAKQQEAWREKLSTFATEVKGTDGYRVEKYMNLSDSPANFQAPEDTQERAYFFHVTRWDTIYLLTELPKAQNEEDADKIARQEWEQKEKLCKEQLGTAFELAFERRREFVESVTQHEAYDKYKVILAHWAWQDATMSTGCDEEDVRDLLDLTANEADDVTYGDCYEAVTECPEWALFRLVYTRFGDGYDVTYHWIWSGVHKENQRLDRLYVFLEAMGYVMSDEERQLQDGTHPLFQKEEA